MDTYDRLLLEVIEFTEADVITDSVTCPEYIMTESCEKDYELPIIWGH